MFDDRSKFRLGLLLTLLSGAAALAHQLLWTHRMTDLLGSSAQSIDHLLDVYNIGCRQGKPQV